MKILDQIRIEGFDQFLFYNEYVSEIKSHSCCSLLLHGRQYCQTFSAFRLPVKRHARVKTWTRHVDLFKKDFVVIPINEQ